MLCRAWEICRSKLRHPITEEESLFVIYNQSLIVIRSEALQLSIKPIPQGLAQYAMLMVERNKHLEEKLYMQTPHRMAVTAMNQTQDLHAVRQQCQPLRHLVIRSHYQTV